MRQRGMISPEERERAVAAPLTFAPEQPSEDPAYTPFLEKIRREVEEKLGPRALQLGGLRIHTTMDPDLQDAAFETSESVLPHPDDPSAAVVTVEPQTGAIRALGAGRASSIWPSTPGASPAAPSSPSCSPPP